MKTILTLAILVGTSLLTISGSTGEIKRITTKNYYLDVPVFMEETSDLNDDASSQYMCVKDVDGTVQELYLIIISETHKEIKSYNLEYQFTTVTYWEAAYKNLVASLNNAKILTQNLQVEQLNGMDCTRGDIYAELGDVNVLYHLGVFKGKKAFYQVLTWTINEQAKIFKPEMNAIINSFHED